MIAYHISAALRGLVRTPFITATNLLGLALGLACFMAAWGTTSYWSLGDAHFKKSDRIHLLTQQWQSDLNGGRKFPITSAPPAIYLPEDAPEIEAIARLGSSATSSMAADGRSISIKTARADASILDIFDFDFVYGSPVGAMDTPDKAVLTERAARRLFGDENPVGREVVINSNDSRTITGVIATIPSPTHFGDTPGVLQSFELLSAMPAHVDEGDEWWRSQWLRTYILLPEENYDAALASLDRALMSMPDQRIPDAQKLVEDPTTFSRVSLTDLFLEDFNARTFEGQASFITVTNILFGLGLIILLVSCINYANMATALAAGQAKEIGLQRVVGAGAVSVGLQYWMQALFLTLLASFLALVCLALAAPVLEVWAGVDIWRGFTANPASLPALIGLVIGVSVLASLYPVFVLTRIQPADAIRAGRIKSGNRLFNRLLVGFQFAAASLLLITVFVVTQQNSYIRSLAVDAAADPVAILVDGESRQVGSEDLKQALATEPSIVAVSHLGHIPWSAFRNISELTLSQNEGASYIWTSRIDVGYDFLDVFQTELIAGRSFDPEIEDYDQHESYSNETTDINIVVDRAFTELQGFPSPQAAIGEAVYFTRDNQVSLEWNPTFRIIGVVETVPLSNGLGDIRANYYWLNNHDSVFPLVRIDKTRLEQGMTAIDAAVKSRHPDAAVSIRFTDSEFERGFALYDGVRTGFTVLSFLALVISAMGLFAMAVFTAVQRRQEIGIRKTLGASTWEIVRLLLRDFSMPVLIANAIAWPLGYLVARSYLEGFMTRIELGPWPWILALVFTLVVAWLAVGGQALRAARVKPANVLKDE